jgi:hypothetical protein
MRNLEEYRKDNPPRFTTHIRYVDFLNVKSKDINLKFNQKFRAKIKDHDNLLSTKVRLINFTLKSLEEELRIISKTTDFAVVCSFWIPVKSYYIIFNCLLILKYLITCNGESFSSRHCEINNNFKEHIEKGELTFSEDIFNKIYTGEEIEEMRKWKSSPGESLKVNSFDEEDRLKHIIKKIIDYKRSEFKRFYNIKRLAGSSNQEFITRTKINLSDFFYCYRIKANYGGMDFLDENISSDKFKEFYTNYYGFLMNYYKCLKQAINKLALIRLGEEITLI